MSIESLPEPRWEGGMPWCAESCPHHDGKRCRLLGFRAPSVCEPAVLNLVAERDELLRVQAEEADVPAWNRVVADLRREVLLLRAWMQRGHADTCGTRAVTP